MAERRSPRQRPGKGPALREALAADAIDAAPPPGPMAGRNSDSAGGSPPDGGPRWSLVPDGRPGAGDGEPPVVDVAAAAVVLVPPSLDPVTDDPLAAALGLPPSPPRIRPAPQPNGQPRSRPAAVSPAAVRAAAAAALRAKASTTRGEPAVPPSPAAPPPAPGRPQDIDLTGLRADTLPTALPPVPPAAPPPVPRPLMAPPQHWASAADVERLSAEVADLRRQIATLDERPAAARRETFEIFALIALVAVLTAVLVVRIVKG